MVNFPTLDEVEEQYFHDHPEEIEPYLIEIFQEYSCSGNSAALLASLRVIARVKGICSLAEEAGMNEQELQNALTGDKNASLNFINNIIHALGYQLVPRKLLPQDEIKSYG